MSTEADQRKIINDIMSDIKAGGGNVNVPRVFLFNKANACLVCEKATAWTQADVDKLQGLPQIVRFIDGKIVGQKQLSDEIKALSEIGVRGTFQGAFIAEDTQVTL